MAKPFTTDDKAFFVSAWAGVLAFIPASLVYILIGMFTGVIASCLWAPSWWVYSYLVLFIAVLAFAGRSAVRAKRAYLAQHGGAGA